MIWDFIFSRSFDLSADRGCVLHLGSSLCSDSHGSGALVVAMMPNVTGFGDVGTQGSPTRMEMGQGGVSNTAAAEVPVPSTPPETEDARGNVFGTPGMQGNGSNVTGGVGNLVGAGNLGFAGNFGAGGLGVGGLAGGSFGPVGNLNAHGLSGCPYPGVSPMTNPFNPQGNVQPGFSGCGCSLPNGGICSGPRGLLPAGGCTQASRLQQIAELVGSLDMNQTRTLQQMLGERIQQQQRVTPDFLGDVHRRYGEPFVSDPSQGMIGGAEDGSGWNRYAPLDAFSKSEKWLTPAPSPNVDAWKSRDLEILGWAEYSNQLVAWAAQGSEEFASEISHAIKWHCPIACDSLTKPQKSRGTRLFSILKAAFSSHPRIRT